ncbi:Wzz/FepE/Etk N-terminal domain-containing protein [Actinoplanes sp. NPDC089786]|uniref:YveK family protein n=1 Tax=Actinoplanes sp. NPDC089786 TaxID=3155185 RepID=UPI0034333F5F
MKSREFLRRLVRRFGLLLLLTAIGGGAGAAYAAIKTPTYTAKAYVVTIGAGAEPIVALNYAQAYGRIATTGPVLATAGQTLGADRTGLNRVTASTSPDAPVIEITAIGPSPSRTATVANAVANSLISLGDTRKGETRVGLTMLAAATPPARPTSPKPPMELAVGAAAGLLIGGLAVLAGAGRRSEETTAPATATAESVTVVAEPERVYVEEPEPVAITSFSGIWRSKQKVLTATPASPPSPDEEADSSGSSDSSDSSDSSGSVAEPSGQADDQEPVRVVGRAVVFRVEEK